MTWTEKATKSDKWTSSGMGYRFEQHHNGLTKGAYLWTGLDKKSRIINSPIYLLILISIWVKGILLNQDYKLAKIEGEASE